MSMAVSNFVAEWLLGGKVLCKVLMACCRCFLYILPNHNCFISKVESFRFRDLGLGIWV